MENKKMKLLKGIKFELHVRNGLFTGVVLKTTRDTKTVRYDNGLVQELTQWTNLKEIGTFEKSYLGKYTLALKNPMEYPKC